MSPSLPSDQPAAPAPAAPLAVVYLPPILAEHPGTELEQLGEKLAVALDRHAVAGPNRYRVTTEFVDLRDRKEKICRLVCRDAEGKAERPVADLYLLDYRPKLVQRQREGILVTRLLLAGLGLAEAGRRVVWQMFRPSHRLLTPPERFQSLVALGFLAVIALYLFTLLLGAIRVIETTWRRPAADGVPASPGLGWVPVPPGLFPATNTWLTVTQQVAFRITNHPPGSARWWLVATNLGPLSTGEVSPESRALLSASSLTAPPGPLSGPTAHPDRAGRVVQWAEAMFDGLAAPVRLLYGWSEMALAALVILGLVSHERGRFTAFLRSLSEELLAFVHYLSFADRRAEITGQVDECIEQLAEIRPGYARLAVMAYSFGSVVALDAFCPPDEHRARRLGQVDTLVTIGSPHDFILTYWPDYFAGRDPRHQPPARWLNVYSPVDVLGSRFRKAAPGQEAVPGGTENSFGVPGRLAFGPTEEVAFRENFVSEHLGWWQTLSLVGLRAHTMYWSRTDHAERNCLHLVVPRLFAAELEGSS